MEYNIVLMGADPNLDTKFVKLKSQKDPSSCEQQEIDCLVFSRTLSCTATMFSMDLALW